MSFDYNIDRKTGKTSLYLDGELIKTLPVNETIDFIDSAMKTPSLKR